VVEVEEEDEALMPLRMGKIGNSSKRGVVGDDEDNRGVELLEGEEGQ
jgi:hypothetical protein